MCLTPKVRILLSSLIAFSKTFPTTKWTRQRKSRISQQNGPNWSWGRIPLLWVREIRETKAPQCWRSGTRRDDQLPEGCDLVAPLRGWLFSVLWLEVATAALDGVATAGPVEEELTPLEVLTELCWMASFCGLLGMDISSQLSSLSETVKRNQKTVVKYLPARNQRARLIRCKRPSWLWCMRSISLIPIMLLLHPFL